MAGTETGQYIKGTKKALPNGWVTSAFRYAFLPEDEQKTQCECSFGCERKVYNEYVADFYEYLESIDFTGGFISYKVPNYTEITKRYDFLDKTNDSFVYNDAKMRFKAAIKKYNETYARRPMEYKKDARKKMKTIGYTPTLRDVKGLPTFHSKKQGKFSYTTNQTNNNIRLIEKNNCVYLKIPKFKNGILLVMHRPLPEGAVIKKATIKREGNNYIVSLSVDHPFENVPLKEIVSEDKVIGLDYSQSDLYVDSDGKKAMYPRFHKIIENRQRRLNKSLARKRNNANVTFSKSYQKTLVKYQKTMAKAKNQRKDFQHKLSNQITNDCDAIVLEDLNLNSMAQALKLGKRLHDNGFGMFRNMIKYKAAKKGKHVIIADKYFASSKICSNCGSKKDGLRLSDRVYACESCHSKIDRDYNAGRNLKYYGIEALRSLGVRFQ